METIISPEQPITNETTNGTTKEHEESLESQLKPDLISEKLQAITSSLEVPEKPATEEPTIESQPEVVETNNVADVVEELLATEKVVESTTTEVNNDSQDKPENETVAEAVEAMEVDAEVPKVDSTDSAEQPTTVDESSNKSASEESNQVADEYLLGDDSQEENKELKDDENMVKIIQDAVMSAGELEPGEQIMILSTDEDGVTKKIILTHAPPDSAEYSDAQQVSDESGNVYLVETSIATEEDIAASKEQDETVEEEDDKTVTTKPQTTRLRNIPSHVLGRNILNPSVDPFRNGKAPPKPRLGVKIPYRNLTSQIVSKQEITEEIIMRARRHNKDNPSGQNLFAKRLKQTLAKKLNTDANDASTSEKVAGKAQSPGKNTKPATRGSTVAPIDNIELLAILENDDDVDPKSKKSDVMTRDLEREIALKQLSELPEDSPQAEKKKVAKKEDAPTPQRGRPGRKSKLQQLPTTDDEEAPRFSVAVPLKTYTRKRKPSDESPSLDIKPIVQQGSQDTKKAAAAESPATSSSSYTTKSSRVIKRKVIWDPDEVSPKKSATKAHSEAQDTLKKETKKDVSPRKGQESGKKSEATKKSSPPVLEKRTLRKREEVEVEEEEEDEEDEEEEEKPKSAPGTPLKQRRRNNEIAKLLQDEGAVNMLYSIKSDDTSTRKPNRKSLESKTNEVLSHLQTSSDKVSPKSLRKKEGTPNTVKTGKKIMCPPTPSPVSRQKSKDSNRSSIHSPPPSPGQSFGGVESRIIRRHSSSSYSSMGEEDDEERKSKKMESRSRRKVEASGAENAKKKIKKEVIVKNDGFEKLVGIKLNPSTKYTKFKTFKVFSLDKLVQIDLNSKSSEVYFTNELMEELKSILNDLESDKSVNVVLLTSSGVNAFCAGLDFKSLLAPRESTRKNLAKKLATTVKEFLMKLATFSKVLAVGIHGNSIGLGVTMLPLFDMILASEKSTFHIPNASLGCIAEGGSLLLLPHLSQNVLISELLYTSQILSSADALKLGLVTKVLPSLEFNKELLNSVKAVSEKSVQFMGATKKQLRQRMISDITKSLESDTDSLIEQWSSDECQKRFEETCKSCKVEEKV